MHQRLAEETEMPRKPKLYTLSEIAKKTRISMSSLVRYKKRNRGRIPAIGEGRTQRYPKEAFAVFKQIKEENLAKRGKTARTGKGAPKKAKKRVSKKRTARRRVDPPKPGKHAPDVSNAALSERLARVETTLGHIATLLQQLISEVKRPIRVTIGG